MFRTPLETLWRTLFINNMFENRKSPQQSNPGSKVLNHSYINVYSELTPQEKRQLEYKSLFKKRFPEWDESLILLSEKFGKIFQDRSDLLLLDLGCGNGNYIVDEHREKIRWGVGFDVSPEETSKNICLDEFFYGDASESLPFDDNIFDVALSLWVLEHLESPKEVFLEILRVLKPEGYFLFTAPNKNFLPLNKARLLI